MSDIESFTTYSAGQPTVSRSIFSCQEPETRYCSNDTTCPYGRTIDCDDGFPKRFPEIAYSQTGAYFGLCLNCIDDYNRSMGY